MSIAVILALCGWIAWTVPVLDMEESRQFDPAAFWCAVAVGLVACLTFQAVATLSRKTKKDRHE